MSLKRGRTLEDLAAEVMRQSDAKADYVADTRRLRFESEDGKSRVAVDGLVREIEGSGAIPESFEVRAHAHAQIAERIKIPKPYYDRMRVEAPTLLDENVNHWFQTMRTPSGGPEKRMLRTLDGDLRAFLSGKYRPLDNDDLMNALLPVLAEVRGDVRFESMELTDTRLYIKATFPAMEAAITAREGDVLRYGLLISNSEVGNGALTVAPWSLKLLCTNGMTHTTFGERRYHVGRDSNVEENGWQIYRDATREQDDKAFWMKAQDSLRAAATDDIFQQVVGQAREAAGARIEISAADAVERVQKKFSLTEDEKGSVLNHLIEGHDLSAWGMANAITATAADVESYDRASDLERFGGNVIELPKKDWLAIAA